MMISVQNVSKVFDEKPVLEDITFEAKQGEILSLIGPSGCGKTTLLRILSEAIDSTTGSIQFHGNKKIGFVFQDSLLLDWLTLKENILLPLTMKEVSEPEKEVIAKKWISFLSLEGFENHYPSQLSGGMKQRVAIARALSYDPPYLLLDEPFASLDEINKEKLCLELLKIKKLGKTIIFVSHNLAEISFLSDKIIVLNTQGKIKKKIAVKAFLSRKPGDLHSKKILSIAKGVRNVIEEEWQN